MQPFNTVTPARIISRPALYSRAARDMMPIVKLLSPKRYPTWNCIKADSVQTLWSGDWGQSISRIATVMRTNRESYSCLSCVTTRAQDISPNVVTSCDSISPAHIKHTRTDRQTDRPAESITAPGPAADWSDVARLTTLSQSTSRPGRAHIYLYIVGHRWHVQQLPVMSGDAVSRTSWCLLCARRGTGQNGRELAARVAERRSLAWHHHENPLHWLTTRSTLCLRVRLTRWYTCARTATPPPSRTASYPAPTATLQPSRNKKICGEMTTTIYRTPCVCLEITTRAAYTVWNPTMQSCVGKIVTLHVLKPTISTPVADHTVSKCCCRIDVDSKFQLVHVTLTFDVSAWNGGSITRANENISAKF